jgi:hypothetical protein
MAKNGQNFFPNKLQTFWAYKRIKKVIHTLNDARTTVIAAAVWNVLLQRSFHNPLRN